MRNTLSEYSYGKLLMYFKLYYKNWDHIVTHVEFSYGILLLNSHMEYFGCIFEHD